LLARVRSIVQIYKRFAAPAPVEAQVGGEETLGPGRIRKAPADQEVFRRAEKLELDLPGRAAPDVDDDSIF